MQGISISYLPCTVESKACKYSTYCHKKSNKSIFLFHLINSCSVIKHTTNCSDKFCKQNNQQLLQSETQTQTRMTFYYTSATEQRHRASENENGSKKVFIKHHIIQFQCTIKTCTCSLGTGELNKTVKVGQHIKCADAVY